MPRPNRAASTRGVPAAARSLIGAMAIAALAALAPCAHAGPMEILGGPEWAGPTAPPATDRGGECGSDTLTQSINPGVIGAATVVCGVNETSADYSLARSFTAPYALTIECVTFGVRLNTGGATFTSVRILQGDITGPYDSLTLLSEIEVPVAAGTTSEFFTVGMPSTQIDAGATFIVELRSPSRLPVDGGDGGLMGFGCNVQGQTAPTYYRGPFCNDPDFIDLADIGFGGRHLVMTVGVEAFTQCPGDTNGDSAIDFEDLNTVLSAFNTFVPDPGYDPAADFDGDDDVDFGDLNVVLGAFNTAC